MTHQKTLRWIIPAIFLLALFAAAMGLFYQTPGQPYPLTTFRGEKVMINGHGLYFYDTVSVAAQAQGNDLITLLVGLPLLVVSTTLAFRGSLRGKLLLSGTLGFFLYTYMSMSFMSAYNALFLVYVALFGLSLIAFILSLLAYDLAALPAHFSERLPRGWIAGMLIFLGCFLTLAWLGRIVPPLLSQQDPLLENTTSLGIQAMDLTLVVPLSLIGAFQLLRRSAWGYLLSSIAVMKIITMGLAVSAMGINQALRGASSPDGMIVVSAFLLITLANLPLAVLLLRSIREPQPRAKPRTAPRTTTPAG